MNPRTLVGLVAATGALLALGGCAHRWARPLSADGAYCVPIGRGQHSTCTTSPVPNLEADAQAKQFQPSAQVLTVYLVRKHSADYRNQVPVSVDHEAPVVTVPESFIRWRLSPGQHTLSLSWAGRVQTLDLQGRAGDMVWVELVGSVRTDASTYHYQIADAAHGRALVREARLIADLPLSSTRTAAGTNRAGRRA
jgi:hypothetical protein